MTDCECPIHRNGDPPTFPLGVPFADRLSVETLPAHAARRIYEAHHSYMPSLPSVNQTHHGILLDDHLVGAVTYRHPLISQMGDVSGGRIVEVARICVGVDMPNLASAGLKRSQDRFEREYAARNDIRLLLTFIREDYDGSMLRALQTAGWEYDGVRETSQPSNRDNAEIHDYDKERWIYDLGETDGSQTTLTTRL